MHRSLKAEQEADYQGSVLTGASAKSQGPPLQPAPVSTPLAPISMDNPDIGFGRELADVHDRTHGGRTRHEHTPH